MPRREDVLRIGGQEVGVSVTSNAARVSEYFKSYPQFADKSVQGMLKVSWCQLYINWVLQKAGYPTFQRSYDDWIRNMNDNIDDGFQYIRKPNNGTYTPKPGDLYYTPKVNNKTTHHMGFIVEVRGNKRYRTLDGNAGAVGNPYYSQTLWSGQKSGNLIGGIGGGVVCYNERIDNGGANIGIHSFIPLPLMIYTQNPYK